MSRHENEVFNEAELEASMERFDKAIAGIIEADKKLKAIDAKIAKKRRMLKTAKIINIVDIGLLPLVW